MASAHSTVITVPPASTSVGEAVERVPGDDAGEQRDRVLEYAGCVRAEHGLERDSELRERLRTNAAEWLD
jgi:hypothetical protein